MADFETVDYERMAQIQSQVATGTQKPTNLTDDESDVWDNAVTFQKMAKDKGLTVHIPSETAGSLNDGPAPKAEDDA